MDFELVRDGYGFRYTFDAGLDMATCQCDIEGVDAYNANTGEFIGHVDWTTPDDIERMSDKDFWDFLYKNDLDVLL